MRNLKSVDMAALTAILLYQEQHPPRLETGKALAATLATTKEKMRIGKHLEWVVENFKGPLTNKGDFKHFCSPAPHR